MRLLKKEECQILESNSSSLSNFAYTKSGYTLKNETVILALNSLLTSWHDSHGININISLSKKAEELSKLLGSKQLYVVNYSYKNYVWAFDTEIEFGDNTFLIYLSKRGLSVQLNNKFNKNYIEETIYSLVKKIVNIEGLDKKMIEISKDMGIDMSKL